MPDYEAISRSLTSPEAILALCSYPQAFGRKKQAQAAAAAWQDADERFVGPSQPFRAPGGSGTGFVMRVYWDASKVTPDLRAIETAISTAVPVQMIKADEKAGRKGLRDKKQGCYFTRMGNTSSPLCQWFLERFGVYADVSQVVHDTDLTENTAAVYVKDGVDHVWTFVSR
jgi:hypothetical protein